MPIYTHIQAGTKVKIPVTKHGTQKGYCYHKFLCEIEKYSFPYLIVMEGSSPDNIGLIGADGYFIQHNSFCTADLELYLNPVF